MPITYGHGIKRPNQKMKFTNEQVQELIECTKDPIHFAENYYTIVTSEGAQKIKLYDYQKKLLKAFQDNRFNILLSSRQSGKCVHYDTLIDIYDKMTGKKETIAIGKLFDIINFKYINESE